MEKVGISRNFKQKSRNKVGINRNFNGKSRNFIGKRVRREKKIGRKVGIKLE